MKILKRIYSSDQSNILFFRKLMTNYGEKNKNTNYKASDDKMRSSCKRVVKINEILSWMLDVYNLRNLSIIIIKKKNVNCKQNN